MSFKLEKYNKVMNDFRKGLTNRVLLPHGHVRFDSIMKTGVRASRSGVSEYLMPWFTNDETQTFEKLDYWRPIATRRAMTDKLNSYLHSVAKYCTDSTSVKARELVSDSILNHATTKLIPFGDRKAFEYMPQTTSPGFPFTRMGPEFKQKKDCHQVFQVLRRLKQTKDRRLIPPCVPVARRALCKYGTNKVRLAWAYPIIITLIEAKFMGPIVQAFGDYEHIAWSHNWFDGGLYSLYDEWATGDGSCGTTDWSGFDSRVHRDVLRWAFSVTKSLFQLSSGDEYLFDIIEDYFINTPILFYNRMYIVKDGVPSGSFFTQWIDSLVNLYYSTDVQYVLSQGREFSTLKEMFSFIKVLGDDNLFKLRYRLSVRELQTFEEIAEQRHGAKLNLEKSQFYFTNYDDESGLGHSVDFLGHTVHNRFEFDVPGKRVLAQVLIPEDPDVDPGDVLTRLVGVAWSHGTNIKIHMVLSSLYDQFKQHYPEARPTKPKRDLADLFRFVFQTDPMIMLGRFPSYDQLMERFLRRKQRQVPLA